MPVKNEEILSAVHDLTLQHKDAFNDMDGRVTFIENGIESITKTVEKIGVKVDGLIEQTIGSEKDIEHLKENFNKLERNAKVEVDLLWEEGIRATKKEQVASCRDAQEALLKIVKDKIEKRALREKIAIYGAVISSLVALLGWLITWIR